MENDIKKEAKRQYIHFFRIWFIIVGVLLVMAVPVVAVKLMPRPSEGRGNHQAPKERVFDYADVLTEGEEEQLRELIKKSEEEIGCDLILVTMRQPVEGSEAKEAYNYRYEDWELNMQDIADDFYDNNMYGYDAPYGDGALILDNWYEGQSGTHLSTSGRIFERFGDYEIDQALTCVDNYIESDPYRAYRDCINYITDRMSSNGGTEIASGLLKLALVLPTVVAGVFVGMNLRSKEGKKTTTATTYIAGGKPVMNLQRDDFIRKEVSRRRIETSSGSGSGGGGGGRGGAHVSSGGHTHGGGSHRR